jgi:CheY-like chemotaxis protein
LATTESTLVCNIQKERSILGGPLAKLRLIVADDSPPFLQKLVSLLSVEFNVVATAADGKTALDLIRRYEPDLAVLDLNMPALNGIEITRALDKNPPSPPVVICSAETDPEIVEAAREAGAVEYVFKVQIEKDLILAAKSAVQDNLVVVVAANNRFDLSQAMSLAK